MVTVKIVLLVLCGAVLTMANFHNLKSSDHDQGYRRLSDQVENSKTSDDYLILKLRQLIDILKTKLERNKETTKRLEDMHLDEARQKKEDSELSKENTAEEPEDTAKAARLKTLLQSLAKKMNTNTNDGNESEETPPSERNFGPHGQEENVHDKLGARNFGPAGKENLQSVHKKGNYDSETKTSKGDVNESQERQNFGPARLAEAENADDKRNFGTFGRSLRQMIDEELEKVMQRRGMK